MQISVHSPNLSSYTTQIRAFKLDKYSPSDNVKKYIIFLSIEFFAQLLAFCILKMCLFIERTIKEKPKVWRINWRNGLYYASDYNIRPCCYCRRPKNTVANMNDGGHNVSYYKKQIKKKPLRFCFQYADDSEMKSHISRVSCWMLLYFQVNIENIKNKNRPKNTNCYIKIRNASLSILEHHYQLFC